MIFLPLALGVGYLAGNLVSGPLYGLIDAGVEDPPVDVEPAEEEDDVEPDEEEEDDDDEGVLLVFDLLEPQPAASAAVAANRTNAPVLRDLVNLGMELSTSLV